MDFTCFFPGWVRYEANRGAAKLDSEAGSGAGADRFILVSREKFPRSFRISVVFFFDLRPSNMLSKRNWNLFCLRKVIEVGSSGST